MFKFKIVRIDEVNCSMIVNFFTDEIPEGVEYNIDVHPKDDGSVPSKEEIVEMVKQYMPFHVLKRAALLRRGLDLSHIHELKDVEFEMKEQPRANQMTQEESLQLIEEILTKAND